MEAHEAHGLENDGYGYVPEQSTYGIVYNTDDVFVIHHAQFFYFHGVEVHLNLPLGNDPSEEWYACSSSNGLIAFREMQSRVYNIGNPFSPSQNSIATIPMAPRIHSLQTTHVVLAVDPSRANSSYFLVCAVQQSHDTYIVDTFSSQNGEWSSLEINMEGGHRIRQHSGVSCVAFAYWLAEPHCVLQFDVVARTERLWPVQFPTVNHLDLDHPDTRLQLGRMRGELGIVLVNGADPRVNLFTINQDTGEMVPFAFLDLAIRDDVDWEQLHRHAFEEDRLECRELPRPIRFESNSKMEVAFLVDGRVLLWEESTRFIEERKVLLHRHAVDVVADGCPHVCTWDLPVNFDFDVLLHNPHHDNFNVLLQNPHQESEGSNAEGVGEHVQPTDLDSGREDSVGEGGN